MNRRLRKVLWGIFALFLVSILAIAGYTVLYPEKLRQALTVRSSDLPRIPNPLIEPVIYVDSVDESIMAVPKDPALAPGQPDDTVKIDPPVPAPRPAKAKKKVDEPQPVIPVLPPMDSPDFERAWWTSLSPEWQNIFRDMLDYKGAPNKGFVRQILALKAISTGSHVVNSIEPLRHLKYLEKVFLHNADISDIEALRQHVYINELSIAGTKVKNIDPVRDMANLEYLYLYETPIADIEPLSGLTKLKSLWCHKTKIGNLKPLRGNVHLIYLDISDTPVSDLEPIHAMQEMKILNLDDTKITTLEHLKGMKNLRHLSLRNTMVSTLAPIGGLLALRKLNFEHTKVSSLTSIEKLTHLTEIRYSESLVSASEAQWFASQLPNCKAL